MSRLWALLAELDARDGHIYAGVGLIGVGGWLLSAAWALIAVGALLLLLGLFAPYLRSR